MLAVESICPEKATISLYIHIDQNLCEMHGVLLVCGMGLRLFITEGSEQTVIMCRLISVITWCIDKVLMWIDSTDVFLSHCLHFYCKFLQAKILCNFQVWSTFIAVIIKANFSRILYPVSSDCLQGALTAFCIHFEDIGNVELKTREFQRYLSTSVSENTEWI